MTRHCTPLFTILIVILNTAIVSADGRMDAAVADMKSYLNRNGFPSDMFQQNQEEVDAIQVNTTWWAFEPGVANTFRGYFPRRSPPSGTFLGTSSFLSQDAEFEEAVMRTLWGENHQHLKVMSVEATIQGIPPEIKSEFQRGTRIQYQKLAAHIQSVLRANGHSSTIRPGLSQMCEITAYGRQPPEGLHPWYREYMRWALLIRVKETSGEHKTVAAGRSFRSAKSRIVLHGYVLMWSTRDNRYIEIGPIFENNFRKHGADPFHLLGGGMVLTSRPLDGHQPSGGITMTGDFERQSPLLLMTDRTALPDYLAPHQLMIANSLLNDLTLRFNDAASPLPSPVPPRIDGPAPAPPPAN